ncbi:hypothetical protein [Anaerovibrio lipolyticus]|nr:hypothetical protein [Anaerovibrio lipolyticus]
MKNIDKELRDVLIAISVVAGRLAEKIEKGEKKNARVICSSS